MADRDTHRNLERVVRRALLAIWRDKDLGDIDVDQASAVASDIAVIHLEHLQQPRVIPTAEGLELRYRVVIPWEHLSASLKARDRAMRGQR